MSWQRARAALINLRDRVGGVPKDAVYSTLDDHKVPAKLRGITISQAGLSPVETPEGVRYFPRGDSHPDVKRQQRAAKRAAASQSSESEDVVTESSSTAEYEYEFPDAQNVHVQGDGYTYSHIAGDGIKITVKVIVTRVVIFILGFSTVFYMAGYIAGFWGSLPGVVEFLKNLV